MSDTMGIDVKELLHAERKLIDERINAVSLLKSNEGLKSAGREIALSYTHLQEAKMWLGQALGMVGSVLPQEFADKAENGQPVK